MQIQIKYNIHMKYMSIQLLLTRILTLQIRNVKVPTVVSNLYKLNFLIQFFYICKIPAGITKIVQHDNKLNVCYEFVKFDFSLSSAPRPSSVNKTVCKPFKRVGNFPYNRPAVDSSNKYKPKLRKCIRGNFVYVFSPTIYS